MERDKEYVSSKTSKDVMFEDGLEDVGSLFTDDLKSDGVGASHLKTAQSLSLRCAYILWNFQSQSIGDQR